jgi:broad specificity phosphatase PhoE
LPTIGLFGKMGIRPRSPTVPVLKPGTFGAGGGDLQELMAISMAQVLLIRPGATLYDEQNRVQGILDIPLSERGRAEAAGLAKALAESQDNTPLSALYCGPGENVIRTAEIIGKALGLRPRRIDELRNLDQGLWQGLQTEEIRRRNTKLFRQWIDDPRTICPPQGETVENAMERIRMALKPLIRRHQDGEFFGLVVGEPLARLVSCYLRRGLRPQLDEQLPCCGWERLDIPPDLLVNGVS